MTSITDELLYGGTIEKPKPSPGGSITDELLSGMGSGHELRNSPDSPITRLLGKGVPINPADDPKRSAGFGTQMMASMPSDIGDRIKYFASKRFPHLPQKAAMARYSVTGNRIYYVDDEGHPVYEEPAPTTNPTGMGKYAASGAGPALPMIGGAAGGFIPGMYGIPGAMGGAFFGDQLRQTLAKETGADNPGGLMQSGKEMALAGGGQAVGRVAVGIGNRLAARDLSRIQTPQAQSQINQLQQDAQRWDIPLTPAETTNLKSLKSQQRVLQDMPRSSDTMGDFYNQRNTEWIPRAVQRGLDMFSPEASSEVGARRLQTGAKAAIKTVRGERAAAAKPLYDEAFRENQNMASPVLDRILETPAGKEALKRASVKMRNEMTRMGVPDAELTEQAADAVLLGKMAEGEVPKGGVASGLKLRAYDYIKRALGDMEEGALAQSNRDDARIIGDLRRSLVGEVDKLDVTGRAGPNSFKPEGGAYARGRTEFAGKSPDVTALTEGAVGAAAEASEMGLNRVPRIIFESGPNAIKQNRAAYLKAGAEQEWQDGLRAYLQDSFGNASKEYAQGGTNAGAKFRTAVFGTPQQKESLKAAMTNDQWLGFNSLMNVLEATGRVPTSGSMTTFNRLAIDDMARQAGGVGGGTAKAAATALEPHNWGPRLRQWIEEIQLGKHSEKLAEVITSPDAMRELKALRLLSPRAEKTRYTVYQVLTQAGFEGAEEALNPEPDNQAYQPDESAIRRKSAASVFR